MRYNIYMAQDKYTAVWVSHSSMGDFLKCPRAYYLKNIYKDPKTNRKMGIVNPSLSLGVSVHNTLEALKNIEAGERMKRNLLTDFEAEWLKFAGKKGGFKTLDEETDAKERGIAMIKRVIGHPGPLFRKSVRLKEGHNGMPPNFYLSDEENIILCGLIDWLEYVDADDSIRILDFKTGKHEEDGDSLQLPIYMLLLEALQKRKVSGALYWYLDRDNEAIIKELPNIEDARIKVLSLAKRVKEARVVKAFDCTKAGKGCFACQPFEAIIRGEAEHIGVGGYGQDMYLL
jgi:ATP-dependent helicase/DNAse subunit B